MTNSYEIRGDIAAILIRRRSGEVYETLVDVEDLRTLDELGARSIFYHSTRNGGSRAAYAQVYLGEVGGKSMKAWLHRLLLSPPKGIEVDHINRDGLDNRRSNLRCVTHQENRTNLPAAQSNSRSGVLGVSWHAQNSKWRARLRAEGREIFLGTFDNIEDAIAARKAGEEAYGYLSAVSA